MDHEEIFKKVGEHKHALIFVAGIATAVAGKKIIESKAFKDTCTSGMAAVLSAKKDAEEYFQDMREDAEEIVIDANEETKKEIYLESEEDTDSKKSTTSSRSRKSRTSKK